MCSAGVFLTMDRSYRLWSIVHRRAAERITARLYSDLTELAFDGLPALTAFTIKRSLQIELP
jgi:hypothetical protein